jgi:hypothetical protein
MFRFLGARLRHTAVVGGLLLAAACAGTDVSAPPQPAADAGLLSDLGGIVEGTVETTLTTVTVVARSPLSLIAPSTVQKTLGPAGGVIELPGYGLRFTVPPGALDEDVKISIRALPGGVVAYEFAPHGLQFKVPATFEQDLRYGIVLPWQKLGGGYFKDDQQVDAQSRQAEIDEALKAYRSNGWLSFPVRHFSGYLVSCA